MPCIPKNKRKDGTSHALFHQTFSQFSGELQQFKKSIRDAVPVYLDCSMTFGKQTAAIDAIFQQITAMYPDAFQCTDEEKTIRTDLLRRYMCKIHGDRRRRPAKGKKYSLKGEVQQSESTSTACREREDTCPLHNARTSSSSTATTAPVTGTESQSFTLDKHMPLEQSISDPAPMLLPTFFNLESTVPPAPAPETLTVRHPTNMSQIAEVEAFLQSCIPPMTRYLPRFLAYGCRNKQFLCAVSRWSKDEIEEFLCALPLLEGNEMSDMEKMILRLHFEKYFSTERQM
ncbi:hypothetical protein BDQ12DRAFT_687976 [Crucibulum laeve]|uniref:Uncharacterized protein n=1 Tax=Crucibulum laeve TaxID=68775 RepID=A0A5C3LTZ5_9AGAR|nr:hypothetical protein BDQ12DRAFT_687976 [Crucibulum laeve]